MYYSIAIDGPAGAGKSTIAKEIARRIGFIYVDTGAMYRAIALYLIRKGIGGQDVERISEECSHIRVSLDYDADGKQQVFLNGENVTPFIRTEQVGKMASVTAAIPAVRAALLDLQREMARTSDVLMDGRDIGTHVLPDASLKIYLTASSAVRARRRYDELVAGGETCDLEEIERDIIKRDETDMNRAIAPLRQADDAVYIDSSEMGIEEVVSAVIAEYKKISCCDAHVAVNGSDHLPE